MHLRRQLVLLSLLGWGHAALAQGGDDSGLKLSIAGDIVGAFGGAHAGRLDPREVELLFYSPIDTRFDAQVSAAAHREDGVSMFELHEAFVSSSKLFDGFRFRLGHYFLGVGRLNAIHRHDWPFTYAPLGHAEFFDDEGVADSGLELSYLLPTPFFLELTAGYTNGWTYGHAHNAGTRPLAGTHYLRTATYAGLGPATGVQVGLNYLGRNSASDGQQQLAGLDAVLKWREGKTLLLLLQSEIWYRRLRIGGGAADHRVATYLFAETEIPGDLRPGLRLDTIAGAHDRTSMISPQLSWKPSEFFTLRATYDFTKHPTSTSSAFSVQSVFFLGAHPAHDF